MSTRRPRGTISRQAIADAALAVADLEGFPAVSVRAVAMKLGASPMSLYTHCENKEAIYDAMFEQLLERILRFEPTSTWQQELDAGCRHGRVVLLAHPHWLPLLTRVKVPPLPLELYDRILIRMLAPGFGPEMIMHAVSAAMSFTLGIVLIERMLTDPSEGSVPMKQLQAVEAILSRLGGAYPKLTETAATLNRWSFDGVFDAGLRALIAGVQQERRRLARRDAARSQAARARDERSRPRAARRSR